MNPFSHLHLHTEFSLLDGFSRIPHIYKKAIDNQMPGLAITDHGNMLGVFKFVAEAHKHKKQDGSLRVKPIVGCEFYMVENRFVQQFSGTKKDKRYHQILLAKNKKGYQNLTQLCSLGYLEGLYGKYPRIDKELLLRHHEGLIATSCCLGAVVPQLLLQGQTDKAEAELKWWLDLFGPDYYIELQRHHLAEQDQVNEQLLIWAEKYHIPTIATNDVHYTDKEDAYPHDILLCVNTQSALHQDKHAGIESDDETMTKKKRFAFPNEEFYMKSTAEMQQLFHDLPEALDNTQAIVDKIDTLQLTRDILLPNFPLPPSYAFQYDYLEHLTFSGAQKRYAQITEEIETRLRFELEVIRTMGFEGYFLIVADFIKAAKDLHVWVGPGRGSAAGSVVAYCIGITNVDPIKYNLLFERFLNPDRKSMPDIDTDFDDEGREKVIDYVCQKYGKNQVAQIVTYATIAARSSIKDVARVHGFPLELADQLAKKIPEKPGIQLRKILCLPENDLKELYNLSSEDMNDVYALKKIYSEENNTDSNASTTLKDALRIEGSVRNIGVHAAGVIIAAEPITQMMPVCRVKDSTMAVSQIEGADIESAGVLKMDFLGLKTLSIIRRTLETIANIHHKKIDIDNIPLDDPKTFALYQRGDTQGTFQFESPGMQKYLKELQPDAFEDLVAMNALYRPGPMEYIPQFIRRKHGKEAIIYDLPEMEPYLKDTYGITVYQEQVMLLSQKIADFSKGDADVLRKAMGKKQKKVLDAMKEQFMRQATQKGHPAPALEKIWSDWEAFAAYAFNKSHSVCYSILAYQTAYLKANYPSAYMAALLDYNAENTNKMAALIAEANARGITILPPDINESDKHCTVNAQGEIRYGFASVKNLSQLLIEALIAERTKNPYRDIYDFLERIDFKTINKNSLAALIYSGCADSFKEERMYYLVQPPDNKSSNLTLLIEYSKKFHQAHNNASGSRDLFSDISSELIQVPRPQLHPHTGDTASIELLLKEREYLGNFLSAHPLDHFPYATAFYNVVPLQTLLKEKEETDKGQRQKTHRRVVGLLTKVQHRVNKSGKPYGSFILEDYEAMLPLSLFNNHYQKYQNLLQENQVVYADIQYEIYAQRTYGSYQILKMDTIEALIQSIRHLNITYHLEQLQTQEIKELAALLQSGNTGNIDLHITLIHENEQLKFKKANALSADNTRLLFFFKHHTCLHYNFS